MLYSNPAIVNLHTRRKPEQQNTTLCLKIKPGIVSSYGYL